MYIEVEIFLNGNQKPNYSQPVESHFEFLQPAGFSGHLLFLLQLQELYLGTGFCQVFTDSTFTDYSSCALDLPKRKKRNLHQYGCFEPETALFTLYLYHHCNGHFFSSRFLPSQGNGLGDLYALYSIDIDADQ